MSSHFEEGKINKVGMLKAFMQNRRFTYKQVVGELFDNAFDAGATSIELEINKNRWRIIDDGKGQRDPHAFLTFGGSFVRETTRSGKYGIGLKFAACWLEGETEIRSWNKSIEVRIKADWKTILEENEYKLLVHDPKPTDRKDGTQITFSKIAKNRRVPKKHMSRILADIQYDFFPALKRGTVKVNIDGRQVVVKGWELPPIKKDSRIVESFQINGKHVTVRGGLVSEDADNPYPGVHVTHAHRVVLSKTAFGLTTTRINRICVWVELGNRQWQLASLKDDITDEDRDVLENRLEELFKPLCSEASNESRDMRIENMNSRLSAMIRQLSHKKEKRSDGESEGTVDPVGSGRTRTPKDPRTQTGVRKTRRSPHGVTIDIEQGDGILIGRFDKGKNVIFLDGNHERVQSHYASENLFAQFECAILVAAQHDLDIENDGRPLLANFDVGMNALAAFSSYSLPTLEEKLAQA